MTKTRRGLFRTAGGFLVGSGLDSGGVLGPASPASTSQLFGPAPIWRVNYPNGFLFLGVEAGQVYVFSSALDRLRVLSAANGETLWEFGNGEGFFSVHREGDTFYAAGYDDVMYALETTSGDVVWRYEVTDTPRIPVHGDGTVYVGDYAGNAYAIDAKTGAERWTRRFETDGAPVTVELLTPDTLHLGATGVRSVFVDPATGETHWDASVDKSYASPALDEDEDTVIVSHLQEGLYAFDLADGTLRWSLGVASGAPYVRDGTVYAPARYNDRDADYYAIDAASGSVRWTYSSEIPIWGGAFAEDTVYLNGRGEGTGAVSAVDLTSGTERWQYTTDGEVVTLDLVDGTVLAGSKDTNAYGLDMSTGELVWTVPTGSEVWNVRAADGRVYVGSNDGTVQAFDRATLRERGQGGQVGGPARTPAFVRERPELLWFGVAAVGLGGIAWWARTVRSNDADGVWDGDDDSPVGGSSTAKGTDSSSPADVSHAGRAQGRDQTQDRDQEPAPKPKPRPNPNTDSDRDIPRRKTVPSPSVEDRKTKVYDESRARTTGGDADGPGADPRDDATGDRPGDADSGTAETCPHCGQGIRHPGNYCTQCGGQL
jgi:outer membrane protein assembly factor BamB